MPLLRRWEETVAEAAGQLPRDGRGRRRLLETQAFYRFMQQEFSRLIERWQEHKDDILAELERGDVPPSRR